MPTVLDSFVIEIGLDPSKFNQSQQDTLVKFQKQLGTLQKQAEGVENVSSHITEAFHKLRGEVLAFGFALLGAGGLKSFVEQQVKLGVEVGRSSLLLDTNAKVLSKWQGVAERSGGSAGGMTASLSGLVSQFQQFAITGESSVIPYFRALGVQIADASGHMRGLDEIMLDLADRFSKMDPAQAAFFGRALGLDDATIALLIKGRAAVKGLLDEQERIGYVSKQQTEAAAEMWKSWTTLSQKLQDLGRQILYDPSLVVALDFLSGDTEALKRHRAQAEKGAKGIPHSGFGGLSSDSILGRLFPSLATAPAISSVAHEGAGPAGGRQTRGDRNNNPGNIEYGPFAVAHGATGSDGRFAVFPTREMGERAMEDLLKGNYQGLTLSQIQQKWVGNADAGYLGSMSAATGLGPNAVPNLSDPAVLHALAAGMSRGEGTHYGGQTINIEKMDVHSKASDAAGIAGDIKDELRKRSPSIQANTGPM